MNNLYVVPTPIGNLDDISDRAKKILSSVKYILCEDTKVSGKLKSYLKLDAKLISFHKFNEQSRIDEVKNLLIDSDVALISDAGTPTISDPGQLLIKELKLNKIKIIPLPGPTAITTALSASGFQFNNFTFIGFFEKEEQKIISKIKIHSTSDLIVAYESPNRINKTLNIIKNNFGNIEISISRELTKIYEEILTGRISEYIDKKFQGELVLIIKTNEVKVKSNLEIYVIELLKQGLNEKQIIDFFTNTKQFKKNEIYNFLKKIKTN